MNERDQILLQDMLAAAKEAISTLDKIAKFSAEDAYVVYRTCERDLAVIGEVSNKVSQETKDKYPEIEWREAISNRNFIIHQYHRVEFATIRDTVENDLPTLVSTLEKVIENVTNGDKNK